jgi:hypothetical protein
MQRLAQRMWGWTRGRARSASADADIRVTGAALVGGLLRGLLDIGVEPQTDQPRGQPDP